MSMSYAEFERLIAEGVIPEWCRLNNPENWDRFSELCELMEKRDLTDEETEELFNLSEGPCPPKEYQERFNREVLAKIEAREAKEKKT